MDILLSETEQNLLTLLEELTKHHDWIEIPVLAEKLNFSIEELQEHLLKLEQLFPNLLIRSTKEGIHLQFETRNSLDPKIAIFENVIPLSVKVAEASAEGKSIYCHCPNGKVSMAYENLTQEVLENEK